MGFVRRSQRQARNRAIGVKVAESTSRTGPDYNCSPVLPKVNIDRLRDDEIDIAGRRRRSRVTDRRTDEEIPVIHGAERGFVRRVIPEHAATVEQDNARRLLDQKHTLGRNRTEHTGSNVTARHSRAIVAQLNHVTSRQRRSGRVIDRVRIRLIKNSLTHS